jgi:tyrosyl-tRNA synthetase
VNVKELLASHPAENEALEEILGSGEVPVNLAKLLVRCGLADSGTDAVRKIKQRAVKVNGELQTGPVFFWDIRKELMLRVGKKMKRVIGLTK